MHRCIFEMPKLTTILNEVKIMIGKFNIMNSMNRYNTKCREIHVWLVKYRLYWNCLRCFRCSILEFWNAYRAIVRYYAENIVRMKGLQERALKTIFSKAEFSTLLLVWNKSHEIFIPYHFVWEKKKHKDFCFISLLTRFPYEKTEENCTKLNFARLFCLHKIII